MTLQADQADTDVVNNGHTVIGQSGPGSDGSNLGWGFIGYSSFDASSKQ